MKKSSESNYHWDIKKIESAVEEFVIKNARLPVAREMNNKNKLPSRRTLEIKTGLTLVEYGKKYHPELVELSGLKHRQRLSRSRKEKSLWTKGRLIEAVGQFVKCNGRVPEFYEYTVDNHLPSYETFCDIAKTALQNSLEEYFRDLINKA